MSVSAATELRRGAGLLPWLQRRVAGRAVSLLFVCALFWIVAAAAHSGFSGKWALRDGADSSRLTSEANPDIKISVESMLNRSATKPFVYRQLVPLLANGADWLVSDPARARIKSVLGFGLGQNGLNTLSPDQIYVRAWIAGRPEYHFRYLVIYYVSFLSLFAALFVLRRMLLDLDMGQSASLVAATGLVLALPYFQTSGGYFYDNVELLFLALGALAALRGWGAALLAIAAVATINKETYLFFIPALYPLLARSRSRRDALTLTAAALAASAAINVGVKLAFWNSPGQAALPNVAANLHYYATLWNYHTLEQTYGIVGPARAFAGTLLLLVLVAVRGWPDCPAVARHVVIAAAINLPLMALFATGGELRNLSLLFPSFAILLAGALTRVDRGAVAR